MTSTNTTNLVALADRLWVIVRPDGALYDDAEGDHGDEAPATFRRRKDAEAELANAEGLAADIGLGPWRGKIMRLGEAAAIGATVKTPPAISADLLPVAGELDLDEAYPARRTRTRTEWAISLPTMDTARLYRDAEAISEGRSYAAYSTLAEAQEVAAAITQQWAVRLGVSGHKVEIFARTTTVSTGDWQHADVA